MRLKCVLQKLVIWLQVTAMVSNPQKIFSPRLPVIIIIVHQNWGMHLLIHGPNFLESFWSQCMDGYGFQKKHYGVLLPNSINDIYFTRSPMETFKQFATCWKRYHRPKILPIWTPMFPSVPVEYVFAMLIAQWIEANAKDNTCSYFPTFGKHINIIVALKTIPLVLWIQVDLGWLIMI